MTEGQGRQVEVEIGSDVYSSDGEKIGSVDQLIVHGPSGRVDGFLLESGLFGSHHHIVTADKVASVEQDRIVLKGTKDESAQLPNVIKEQIIRDPGSLSYAVGISGMALTPGGSDHWMIQGQSGGQLPHTGADSLYMTPTFGNAVTENIDNLPEDSILISKGTDVRDSNGKKIGTVDAIDIGESRTIVAFTMTTGWFFNKKTYRIPRSAIHSGSESVVRINISEADVLASGAI
jgi:uncharacterized protein YrrD